MPRINHIALKVEDLDKTADFYEKVFGLSAVGKSRSEDRSRNRLSDGEIDLTFLKYDNDKSDMALAAGGGPCIHHFAIEVDDLNKYVAEVRKAGCEILGDSKTPPIKFRLPGGPLAEIVPANRYQKKTDPGKTGRIVHLAMRVGDIDKTSDFFANVFGFTRVEVPGLRETVRYMTDGTVHMAINKAAGTGANEGKCDHFGIEVNDITKCATDAEKYGCEVVTNAGSQFKFRAPGGIIVEPVAKGSKPGIGETA
jgi:catechol 2,3-dioxygenase-like lactoylglutathione lyase family enzyme